uniref:dihydrofolate reductase n=1 Tax=viral metagenome TaxID=1070528 RepID=A0A6C0I7F9_9ZZZZ
MLNLIYCVDNSGLFGRRNTLPWYFKEDLKYFKDITINFNKIIDDNIIVMGYNTWTSLKSKLPNRINILISSRYNKNKENKEPDYCYKTFDDFINDCKKDKTFYNRNIFIIGGKKLLSYAISKYHKLIKHVFINIIQHSFPQFLDDVIFKIYSFHNFEISRLSYNTIYCQNLNDSKYYHIAFNQYINKNFDINYIHNFTNLSLNQNENHNINNKINENKHENHRRYTILEDVQDVPLHYCKECDTIIKQPLSYSDKCNIICNDCLKNKCKCLFC